MNRSEFETLMMAHDNLQRELADIKRLMDKDKHALIKSNIALNKRVQELKKERSEWKGKYSILKNKYRALQRKMKNRWRYNRALENESRTNAIVLEEFREQNKRYREALEFYAYRENYKPDHYDPNIHEYMSVIDYDEGATARKALEGEE